MHAVGGMFFFIIFILFACMLVREGNIFVLTVLLVLASAVVLTAVLYGVSLLI